MDTPADHGPFFAFALPAKAHLPTSGAPVPVLLFAMNSYPVHSITIAQRLPIGGHVSIWSHTT
jgi:hypothetical protein